jgi:Ankyrin repeats (3 copies)
LIYPRQGYDLGNCGSTALHDECCQYYASSDAIIELVRQGADTAARTCDGSTPLHKAVTARKREAVKALITATAAVQVNLLTQQNNAGQNALHLAVSYDKYHELGPDLKLIELLLTGQVNRMHLAQALAMADTAGRTPLQVAVEQRYIAASRRLLEVCDELGILPAVLRHKDMAGTDVVMLARRMEGDELCQLLKPHCVQVCAIIGVLCANTTTFCTSARRCCGGTGAHYLDAD